MSRLCLAALLLTASTSAVSAGTYVGLGIGTAASGSAERSDGIDMGSVDGYERSGRLLLGSRLGKLSIEGQGSRFNARLSTQTNDYEATQLGVGLKLGIPIGNSFEIFGRGGVQRTWLSSQDDSTMDAVGNGWLAGAGVEYRLDLGVTAASLFLDYQRSSTGLTSERMIEFDVGAGMWTLGMTVSL